MNKSMIGIQLDNLFIFEHSDNILLYTQPKNIYFSSDCKWLH